LESAVDAIGDAATSEEAFAALQSWSQRPEAQKADAYAVEQELFRGGMEVLRRMLGENFRSRGLGDVASPLRWSPTSRSVFVWVNGADTDGTSISRTLTSCSSRSSKP
jgi:hypothetical protein